MNARCRHFVQHVQTPGKRLLLPLPTLAPLSLETFPIEVRLLLSRQPPKQCFAVGGAVQGSFFPSSREAGRAGWADVCLDERGCVRSKGSWFELTKLLLRIPGAVCSRVEVG